MCRALCSSTSERSILWNPAPRREGLTAFGLWCRLGPVRHLVSPNKIHHLFLGEWAQA